METRVCKKCGIEKKINFFDTRNDYKDRIYTRGSCRECMNKSANEARHKNIERHREKTRINYAKNKKQILKRQNDWKKNHPESLKRTKSKKPDLYKNIADRQAKKQRTNLTNYYIVGKLKAIGFSKEQIIPELIEVQRLIIKTKRLCKTLQTSEQA